MRWIGIDEAGYGPNLGPMVMAAVVAEGPGPGRPDPWRDCPSTVGRAGDRGDRLWIDDSKRLYRGGVGLDRLEAAAMAALEASGVGPPAGFRALLGSLGVDPDGEAELLPWLPPDADLSLPSPSSSARVEAALRLRPFAGAPWRIVAVRAVVIGPRRFNAALEATRSKALVHFSAFAELLRWAWEMAADGTPTLVRADKHGGRHFYSALIRDALPPFGLALAPGPEGPTLSRYLLSSADPAFPRRLGLELLPRADADDGLVALASAVGKLVREHWMAAFNAYWQLRIPELRPTAGYPLDASRFRRELLARLPEPDPPVGSWWRAK